MILQYQSLQTNGINCFFTFCHVLWLLYYQIIDDFKHKVVYEICKRNVVLRMFNSLFIMYAWGEKQNRGKKGGEVYKLVECMCTMILQHLRFISCAFCMYHLNFLYLDQFQSYGPFFDFWWIYESHKYPIKCVKSIVKCVPPPNQVLESRKFLFWGSLFPELINLTSDLSGQLLRQERSCILMFIVQLCQYLSSCQLKSEVYSKNSLNSNLGSQICRHRKNIFIVYF